MDATKSRFSWKEATEYKASGNGENGSEPTPPVIVPKSVYELPAVKPPDVLKGLVRQTEMLLVGSHPKMGKSWTMLDMLYCVANGLPWLIWPSVQGRVIHLDLELLAATIRERLELIQKSYGKGSFDNIEIISLRGRNFTLADLVSLSSILEKNHYNILSLDPTYRFFTGPGISELDAGSVTNVLNKFLNLGTDLGTSIALMQHFSKGNQSEKDALDRYSGSGVWARFPDSPITFTELEEDKCYRVEGKLRDQPPFEPFSVRWQYPRLVMDKGVDPEQLKVRKAGRPPVTDVKALCSVIRSGEYISYSDLERQAESILKISKSTFDRLLREAKEKGMIYQNPTDGTYALSSKQATRN
jgi:AAA domain